MQTALFPATCKNGLMIPRSQLFIYLYTEDLIGKISFSNKPCPVFHVDLGKLIIKRKMHLILLQTVNFRIVSSEELLSLPQSCSRLERLLTTSCSSQKWAATQHSHSVLFCGLQQPPGWLCLGGRQKVSPWILTGMFTQQPKDIYLHVLSSAPPSEVFGAPQRKGNEVGGGREGFFTSQVPRSSNPHAWSHTFWVWWDDPPVPFPHWTVCSANGLMTPS